MTWLDEIDELTNDAFPTTDYKNWTTVRPHKTAQFESFGGRLFVVNDDGDVLAEIVLPGFAYGDFVASASDNVPRLSTALRLLVEVGKKADVLRYAKRDFSLERREYLEAVGAAEGRLFKAVEIALANEDAAQLLGGDDETE